MENCAEQPNKALVSDLSGEDQRCAALRLAPHSLGVISNRMKIVYRARDITEAEIVKGMLLSNEIEAHVSGYFLQGGIGEIAPTDLAKVHVADEDYERAREIIGEYEGKGSEPSKANSSVDASPESSTVHKFLITLIVVIVVSLLSYWVGL